MAHIRDTLAPHFTGHVGPVPFTNGHAECTDPELLAYFAAQPERYDVDGLEPDPAPLPDPEPQE